MGGTNDKITGVCGISFRGRVKRVLGCCENPFDNDVGGGWVGQNLQEYLIGSKMGHKQQWTPSWEALMTKDDIRVYS